MTINGLQAKLISKKGGKAQIEIEGQVLEVSADHTPSSASAGENLRLYFLNSQDGQVQEKKLAKAILEEILNGN